MEFKSNLITDLERDIFSKTLYMFCINYCLTKICICCFNSAINNHPRLQIEYSFYHY